MNVRVIPRLDIKGPNLVKGIHLEGLRVLGKPEDFAHYYYTHGADELIYQDAVASLYGRNSLLEIIEKTAREIFIPLTVGGGLRNLDDIRTVLRAGADKVAINSAAIRDPNLIKEAALAFGSSTIVIAIEAYRHAEDNYEAFIDYGRENTNKDAFEWALEAVKLGAGELVVTSINNEGTGKGYDLALTRRIAEAVPIPVIASGGAGNVGHVVEVLEKGKADAVSMASVLHYEYVQMRRDLDSDYSVEGNIEFLQGKRGAIGRQNIEPATISEIKQGMVENGIPCRVVEGVLE